MGCLVLSPADISRRLGYDAPRMNDSDSRPRRLLTIGHSYCIALNRRLANEMAVAGRGEWEVTCAAPKFLQGDLRPVHLERSENEACRLEPVPLHFSRRIHGMWYGRRLRQLMREPWDVIHCWQEPYIVVGGQIARWTPPGTQLVYASFQNISKNYPPPFASIERYAMRRAAGWIAFGKTVEENLAPRPFYAELPHRVIPLGVDLDRFKPDPDARARVHTELGWTAPGPPVVGYLGRFVEEKGLDLLLRTLNGLDQPWRALFVGSGPMEKELRAWADASGSRARIVTGVVHDAVPDYVNAMDMLVAPSQTRPNWREQLGRMLLEAFACGVPVIASDSGEIPQVVGDAGVIVGEADAAGWANAISRMLGSSELRAEYAAKGRTRAETEFTWPRIARRHLDFFEELTQR
jgi:glycosyltransferase involved in cell wall biosynthesis